MDDIIQLTAKFISDPQDLIHFISSHDVEILTPPLKSFLQLVNFYPVHLLWPELLLPEKRKIQRRIELIQAILPLYTNITLKCPSKWVQFKFPKGTKLQIFELCTTMDALRYLQLWYSHLAFLWVSIRENDVFLERFKQALGRLRSIDELILDMDPKALPLFLSNLVPMTLSSLRLEISHGRKNKTNVNAEWIRQLTMWLGQSTIDQIGIMGLISTPLNGQALLASILSKQSIHTIDLTNTSLTNAWPQSIVPDHIRMVDITCRPHDDFDRLIIPFANSKLKTLHLTTNDSQVDLSATSDEGLQRWMDQVIPTLPCLEDLVLANCHVAESSFGVVVGALPRLKSLVLNNNDLTHKQIMSIPNILPKCQHLRSLMIIRQHHVKFSQAKFHRLAPPSLRYLTLDR